MYRRWFAWVSGGALAGVLGLGCGSESGSEGAGGAGPGGGNVPSGGGSDAAATGGAAAGGPPSTGGTATGGAIPSTGSAGSGGTSTGGTPSGGAVTGGSPSSGGTGPGGSNAGGTVTGGQDTMGGAPTGGATGGVAATGGAATGGSSAGGTPPTGGTTTGGTSARCERSLTDRNKATVDAAIDALFVQGQVSAIDQYWADPYIQHNPIAESGVAAFREVFAGLVSPGQPIYDPVRTIGECELVLIHGNYPSFTGPMFDMFRVQDDHLVEHWDAGPAGPGPNASGHTALDGPTTPSSPELTEINKRLVLGFVDEVLIAGNDGAATTYLDESLIEHAPDSADGRTTFVDYRATNAITISTVHHVIADGDFVFTMTEGAVNGSRHGFYDLYRIEDSMIVEHWDGRREVPTSTASGEGIF